MHFRDVVRVQYCYSKPTPTENGLKLPRRIDADQKMIDIPFREAVRKLMYLAVSSRPDISYAISELSRHVSQPSWDHWIAVKRIFRYLKGTSNSELVISGKDTTLDHIKAYSDADWGGDLDKRRSRSGYCILLGGGCISWRSKLQSGIAQSTLEAEYIAINETGREVDWLELLLAEMGITCGNVDIIKDNQGCIATIKNRIINY
jgi:hypothetical protein